jgi:alpha-L-rhamnosidase
MPLKVSRRGFVASSGAAAIAGTGANARSMESLGIEDLCVDGIPTSLNLHTAVPRLSWKLRSARRATVQQRYRIGVASSRENAMKGAFDLWDSGQVESAQSFDIRYRGKPLISRTRPHWQVEVWDDQGAHARSAIASWEMGLLREDDWSSAWIGAETAIMREDRLAGLPWLGGSNDAQASGAGRSYRLAIDLPQPATLTIFLNANRQPEVFLDGRPVPLPPRDPDAFGPSPPYKVTISVPRGRRLLTLFVPGRAGAKPPRGAMLVRAELPSGKTMRIDGTRARTAAGRPARWNEPGLDDRDWEAVRAADGEGAAFPGEGAFLLRRAFDATGSMRSARLYMVALGSYVPMLNGRRVGDRQVTPEWTDFRRHVLYRAYDVTDQVKPGANVLGAIVGDGWYGSYLAPAGRFGFGGAPLRLRAQLEIDYADGRREIIASDDRWSVARASITSSDIYNGEEVDARLDQPGWADVGFSPRAPLWEPAQAVDTAKIDLLGAAVQPIKPSQWLKPKSIDRRSDGSAVVDFGQNFAGWVRLRVRGESGRKLTMRFAELLTKGGDVDQTNLRAARATDTYTLRGGAAETFEPFFTYHGFRYVQIEGLSGPLAADAIDGVVVHSSLPETGQLTLGQYVPQRLWQNGLWSQRSNFFGTPTDCPQRDERLGWTGDAHVFWDAACFNMDTAAFTRKFMLDLRDGQREDGSFPDVAPDSDRANFTGPGSSPGWGDAGVFLPWTSWRRFGDTAVIDEHWEAMDRFLESIRAPNPDLLWKNRRGNDYGDWLSLDGKEPGDPTTPKDLVGTAMWKAAADAMVDMAAATGRSDENHRYRELSAAIGRAFNRAYVGPDGTVGNGSQTGYILALHFNLLPGVLRKPATEKLVADIERRGKLLSTGFLGTPYSLDVLAEAGHDSLVYDLLLRTAYPSWGYMIAHNATTIWERWNGDVGSRVMNSFNHYALGGVAGFMFRRIAGISPIEPGFARFEFNPIFDARMRKAGGRYESQAGLIATAWEWRSDREFALDISIPANARCTLHLPTRSIDNVLEGGRRIGGRSGFKPIAREGRLVLEIGSGDYAFTLKP